MYINVYHITSVFFKVVKGADRSCKLHLIYHTQWTVFYYLFTKLLRDLIGAMVTIFTTNLLTNHSQREWNQFSNDINSISNNQSHYSVEAMKEQLLPKMGLRLFQWKTALEIRNKMKTGVKNKDALLVIIS